MSTQESPFALCWQFMLILFVAVGGLNSALPDIHRFVVDQHAWLTAQQFGEVYALSQATPGPNVMLLTMLGAVLNGWSGAVALTVATFLPGTLLTSLVIHLHARNPKATLALAVRRGLAPVVIGLAISSAWVMLGSISNDWRRVLMSVAVAVLVSRSRMNPLWLVGAGALIGAFDIL